ncbi:MAG: GFA family protein [Novosphingobium sp.]|uniref:GFA family protein n=1 Tax=Novosphingobium sp. TaxID=1874826 RepID=UPI0032BE605F
MKIDGQCHCGEIAWEAEIDPARIVICHCTDCQVMGGGAFLWGVPVPLDQLTFLRGTPKAYRKQGTTGAWRRLHFCATCSTPLYGTEDAAPQTASLRLGSCNQAREFTPALQLWHRSALDWVDQLGAVPAIETQPGGLYSDI